MRKNSEQTLVRYNKALGWQTRITKLSGVLGAVLLLALLNHPGQALGVAPVVPPSTASATLAWDSSTSPGVAGYRVYYGLTSGNYESSIVAGNATTNTVPGLVSGVPYFFAVKAYDTNGLESTLFSNEVSYVPGLASLQIRVTSNRQAVLTVKGPVGRTYDIQASPNFTTWTVIGNVTLGAGGSLDFTDTNAPSFPKRFYRARDTQP